MSEQKNTQCRECGSVSVWYDPNHGFYECLECEAVWGYDEIAEEVDCGPCCACDATGPTVRHFIALEKKSPVPEQGWGCVICEFPCNGALAVVCDSCLETERLPRQAIYGYPSQRKRISIEALREEFKHNDLAHANDYSEEEYEAR